MCSEQGTRPLAADHDNAAVPPDLDPDSPARRRFKIWQMRGNVQCSIVGTCLSEGDLKKILARCQLRHDPTMPSYDLHGYFANAICKDCPVARMVQKTLDRRHEGIIRRVGRITAPEELAALWDAEFSVGRIPGAYWAYLTHAHVPAKLHARVFGEVHMLSHLLGRTAQSTASKVSELESMLADAEAKLGRMRTRHQQALDERDRVIEGLQKRLREEQSREPSKAIGDTTSRRGREREARLTQRRERAICTARQRARAAETQVQRLEVLLSSASIPTRPQVASGSENAQRIEMRRLQPRGEPIRVLYVGGRTGGVDKLRDIASGASAELIHHDGGLEETVANLDRLLDRCHAVFCPVDCVSHAACLKAKHLCRKQGKAFVPLRSSGAASFKRALEGLHYGIAAKQQS